MKIQPTLCVILVIFRPFASCKACYNPLASRDASGTGIEGEPFAETVRDAGRSSYDSLDDVVYADQASRRRRGKKSAKLWDHWGKWSACSATCGVGRMTRWRHCVSEGCDPGEKEAQIKTCPLPPCH